MGTDQRTRGYRSESGYRSGTGFKLESYIHMCLPVHVCTRVSLNLFIFVIIRVYNWLTTNLLISQGGMSPSVKSKLFPGIFCNATITIVIII